MSKKICRMVVVVLTLVVTIISPLFNGVTHASLVRQDVSSHMKQERSVAGGIAVVFGGQIVCWVIDGVIQYTTGKAPNEWVAWGLGQIESYIRSQVQAGSKRVVIRRGSNTCGTGGGAIAVHCGVR